MRVDVRGVSISHPDRVVYPQDAISKLDLARYHDAVAGWALPHLRSRPLTLVRCGEDIGDCSFLRHSKVWAPQTLMGVVELHTWNTRDDAVELPDRGDEGAGPRVLRQDRTWPRSSAIPGAAIGRLASGSQPCGARGSRCRR
jgi:DNA primase